MHTQGVAKRGLAGKREPKREGAAMSDSTALGIAAVARACAEHMRGTREERSIQAGIDATMREVIATRGYNPVMREPSPTVTVASGVKVEPGAPLARGTGWAQEVPLAPPVKPGSMEDRVIGAMIDQALGPAVPPKKE
jgi:hypothetical protein